MDLIQTLILLARWAGRNAYPQEAWTLQHKTVADFLAMPTNRLMFCGPTMGYADIDHPVNRVRLERAPLEGVATLNGV